MEISLSFLFVLNERDLSPHVVYEEGIIEGKRQSLVEQSSERHREE